MQKYILKIIHTQKGKKKHKLGLFLMLYSITSSVSDPLFHNIKISVSLSLCLPSLPPSLHPPPEALGSTPRYTTQTAHTDV